MLKQTNTRFPSKHPVLHYYAFANNHSQNSIENHILSNFHYVSIFEKLLCLEIKVLSAFLSVNVDIFHYIIIMLQIKSNSIIFSLVLYTFVMQAFCGMETIFAFWYHCNVSGLY